MSEPWVPHSYQREGIKFMVERAYAALFLDPGLGKTSITLAAILMLKELGLAQRALIVAPLRVCYSVWPKEIQKWNDFNGLKCVILHGAEKDAAAEQDADVYLINPEGLSWLLTSGHLKRILPEILVVDESTKFKNTQSQRFKLLKALLHIFKRRYILTGTPAPNGLIDLYGQIYLLDQGNSLGPYISRFRNDFFYQTGYGGYTWAPRPGSMDGIYNKIKPFTLRLDARDHLELPERIDNMIHVELPPDARKAYFQMEQALIAQLRTGEIVTATSAAAAGMKCRQIANGGIYRQLDYTPAVNSERWEIMHSAKTDALLDLVDELNGSPLLVAYEFEHDKARLLEALGPDTPWIGGGISPRKSADIEARWNAGQIPVLLGQPQSMAHGLNLQGECGHIAWYSLTWDLECYDQFNRRVLRQGSNRKAVIIHHIIASNTIDSAVMKALRRKDGTQGRLLDCLNDYAKSVQTAL